MKIMVKLLGIFLVLGFPFGILQAQPAFDMKSPQSIELSGLERQVSIASPLGRIQLRWTRDSEQLFGKTPERATIEAASAVAKALKQSSFPSRLKSLGLNWNIIFLNEDLKQGQVPAVLINNCHPGWMTPPSNIYIASKQAAGGCGAIAPSPGKVADNQLARVLIHEMGHAVEFALAPKLAPERARAEGFATWFEVFAGRFSGLLDSASILSQQKYLARQKANSSVQGFNGGADDYALAGSVFHVVTNDKSVFDLTRIYGLMENEGLPFPEAILKVTGWSEKQLDDKIKSFLK